MVCTTRVKDEIYFGEQNVTSNLCEMENFTSQLQVIIEIVKCDPKLNFIKLDIGEILRWENGIEFQLDIKRL